MTISKNEHSILNKNEISVNNVSVNDHTVINSETILTNLKILSNIKPNDKLTIVDNIFSIDSPYIVQGIYRWWNQDSRNNTILEIERLINNAFKIIDTIYCSELNTFTSKNNNYYYKQSNAEKYFQTENSQQLQIFSSELTNTIKGLQHLKLTYKQDISMCSKIDIVIDKIHIRIKKINQLLTISPNNFVSKDNIDVDNMNMHDMNTNI